MVIVAAVRLALSLGNDPLLVVASFLLGASALGAAILMVDLLSSKHPDRLSTTMFRRLAWTVAILAAVALLLLAMNV
jgi:hypothetical protein